MTARTWLGGRNNNQVSSSKNWSPNGALQPGDILTVPRGTVNISGAQLPASDTLTLTGSATVNIRNGVDDHLVVAGGTATVNLWNSTGVSLVESSGAHATTINAFGNNNLNVSTPPRAGGGPVTVNNHGVLTGGFSGFGSGFTVNGGLFANTETTAGYDGQRTVINADVVGTGNFTVGSFHAPLSHALEFVKSVGADQTVTMGSGIGFAIVEVDHPETFNAAIRWETPDGVIDLNGLAADSYKDHDGVLDFFHGDSVVKSLRFTEPRPDLYSPGQWQISQGTSEGAAGIEIRSTGHVGAPPFGADLPLHS